MSVTPFLYVPFAAWVIAQVIKFGLAIARGEGNVRYLYASGGMPSVHSAVVCSLATWALIDGGMSSPLFGITAVFAGIVMYDSFGVRRSAGDQARTLNQLIADLVRTGHLKNASDYNELREILGHRPLEVLVGATLGVVIAILFGWNQITTQYPALYASPNTAWTKVLLVFGGILLIGGPLKYVWGVKHLKKTSRARSMLNYIVLSNIATGILLVVSSFLAYEGVGTLFSQWFFIILVLMVWLLATIVLVQQYIKSLRNEKVSTVQLRKKQWLARAKRKKR